MVISGRFWIEINVLCVKVEHIFPWTIYTIGLLFFEVFTPWKSPECQISSPLLERTFWLDRSELFFAFKNTCLAFKSFLLLLKCGLILPSIIFVDNCWQGEILAVSLCLLLSMLVLASILGNSLVCLAVTTDPNLRSSIPQNVPLSPKHPWDPRETPKLFHKRILKTSSGSCRTCSYLSQLS